jgi:hypothetical protein
MPAPYSRIGLHAAKKAAKELGLNAISKATASGRSLLAWRDHVISDMGGRENVTAAKLALIDAATTTRYVIGVVDAWILGQESLLHERKDGAMALRNVVLERGYVVNLLRNLLTSIGLERQARSAITFEAIAREYTEKAAAASGAVEVQVHPEPPTPSDACATEPNRAKNGIGESAADADPSDSNLGDVDLSPGGS